MNNGDENDDTELTGRDKVLGRRRRILGAIRAAAIDEFAEKALRGHPRKALRTAPVSPSRNCTTIFRARKSFTRISSSTSSKNGKTYSSGLVPKMTLPR